MKTKEKTVILIHTTLKVPLEKVWKYWTTPEYIVKWNYASEDWHTPWVENDLHEGGKFNYRMEAKDGSMGFDFAGVYNAIILNKHIECTLGDGRKVKITFSAKKDKTEITESFETENTNSIELQRNGWQAILNNFKKYAEQMNNDQT